DLDRLTCHVCAPRGWVCVSGGATAPTAASSLTERSGPVNPQLVAYGQGGLIDPPNLVHPPQAVRVLLVMHPEGVRRVREVRVLGGGGQSLGQIVPPLHVGH